MITVTYASMPHSSILLFIEVFTIRLFWAAAGPVSCEVLGFGSKLKMKLASGNLQEEKPVQKRIIPGSLLSHSWVSSEHLEK
jgi:hypothetical protein